MNKVNEFKTYAQIVDHTRCFLYDISANCLTV